jgi:hypothetical protein
MDNEAQYSVWQCIKTGIMRQKDEAWDHMWHRIANWLKKTLFILIFLEEGVYTNLKPLIYHMTMYQYRNNWAEIDKWTHLCMLSRVENRNKKLLQFMYKGVT